KARPGTVGATSSHAATARAVPCGQPAPGQQHHLTACPRAARSGCLLSILRRSAAGMLAAMGDAGVGAQAAPLAERPGQPSRRRDGHAARLLRGGKADRAVVPAHQPLRVRGYDAVLIESGWLDADFVAPAGGDDPVTAGVAPVGEVKAHDDPLPRPAWLLDQPGQATP